MNRNVIKVITISMTLLGLFLVGCSFKKTLDINILATTDLHGILPYEIVDFIKEDKAKYSNTIVVDAGDFYDKEYGTSGDMLEYFEGEREANIPLAKEMKEAGFDAVTLGNHEFISKDKEGLDSLVSDFEKQGISVLSANTYNKNGESYVKPYIIKELGVYDKTIKVGILGLSLKEVGEDTNKSMELKDQQGYEGKLYMNDLVKDAQKWVDFMKEKEKPDVIIAVVHSGERPKKPKHPGNRIQDLVQNVSGIDVIVCGHNHVQIKQNDYKNKDKETVIVTEPGKYGECISKINIKLKESKSGWDVLHKSSDIIQFDESKKNLNDLFENYVSMLSSLSELINEGKEGEVISLDKQLSIKWDKMYIFKPNTPREEIYEKVGYKFLKITEIDDANQVVLMNKGKVVYYSHMGEVKKNNLPFVFNVDNDKFDKNVFTINYGENDDFKVLGGEKNFYTESKIVELSYKGK